MTWKAAFRFRLFWVLAVLLVAAVIGLPLILVHDGTAQGFTQIVLTYTLAAITTLLGFATLWLACGTLARDIDECQMQVVATKPVARWEIWLGKWLGIVGLNAALLALSGCSVYFLMEVRAGQLPADQREILRDQIFTARASLKVATPNLPELYREQYETNLLMSRSAPGASLTPEKLEAMRQQAEAQIRASLQVIPPDTGREWEIDTGFLKSRLKQQPLRLRVKCQAANPNPAALYLTLWHIGPTNARPYDLEWQLPPDSFQERQLPPGLIDANGILTIRCENPNDTSLLFTIEEGLEVLYPEAGFALNLARGLGVILCWLALFAAMGLAAASFLSFNVAAFASLAALVVGLSSGTLTGALEAGTIGGLNDAGQSLHPIVDAVVLTTFRGMLGIIKMAQSFSPIDSLSTGRSITWGQLGLASLQIVVVLGGVFMIIGIICFTRRELASGQNTG